MQFWRERDYPIVVWLLSLPGVSLAILWRSVPDMSGFNAILASNHAWQCSDPSQMLAILTPWALLALGW
ncbi:hypothetical protein [Brucella anthropi]|uniref:hypothetical protein n=1 Tax=Brucella anthropi TaxID=529 RepID=UPI001F41CCE2|nr:hypothetical protein [Brucella anthropi]